MRSQVRVLQRPSSTIVTACKRLTIADILNVFAGALIVALVSCHVLAITYRLCLLRFLLRLLSGVHSSLPPEVTV